MKRIAGFLAVSVVLALAGGVALGVGAFERNLAAADESLATFRYADAEEQLDAAAGYAWYARLVPGSGDRALRELEERRASLQYWRQQYDVLLPRDADPVGAVPPENVELQLVVANGAYRIGQARATSRETTLQALDEAIAGYLTVLQGDRWDERAAYNYEYLVRLRDELTRGRMKTLPPPDAEDAAHGAAGAPARTPDMQKFEVFIPLEGEERNEAAEAGKGTPNKRKG